MSLRLVALALTGALAGCASLETPDPGSPYYRYPASTTLVLRQLIDVPEGQATVRFQNGQSVPRGGVNETDAHCVLEVNTVSDGTHSIQPDRFRVLRAQREVSPLAVNPAYGFRKVDGGDDSGPSQLFYKTVFVLASARQPDVLRLTCQSEQASQAFRQPLTLNAIEQALGEIFRFEFANAPVRL